MSVMHAVATATGDEPTRARARAARHLARYPRRCRATVSALAARHPYLADLAVTFPALLHALAVPRTGFDAEPVIRDALAGASLKQLARQTGLPLWSRRLMPEAFEIAPEALPDGELIRRQITNHLPRSPKLAAPWLDAVSRMTSWGTPDAAVWIAKAMLREPKSVRMRSLPLVALHAWYSAAPDTYAGRLVETRWQPAQTFKSAHGNALDWLNTIGAHAKLAGPRDKSEWLRPGIVDGFEFRPISTEVELCAEAKAMQHCVRNFAGSIRRDRSWLFSVRRGIERIATIQVARWRADPLPQIIQIYGVRNSAVTVDISWAARKWLHSNELNTGMPHRIEGSLPLDRGRWHELWRPYWLAKRRIPAWLPLAATEDVLHDLDA